MSYIPFTRIEDCSGCLQNWKLKFDDFMKHMNDVHCPPKHRRFAFTLTTNLDTQLEVQKEMCDAAWKLINQNTTPVRKAEVYLEYTQEGRPHLHGWYQTEQGGRIFSKTFKRVWSSWGETKTNHSHFTGGYHQEIKSDRYIGYAADEGRLVCSKDGNDVIFNAPVAHKWWI